MDIVSEYELTGSNEHRFVMNSKEDAVSGSTQLMQAGFYSYTSHSRNEVVVHMSQAENARMFIAGSQEYRDLIIACFVDPVNAANCLLRLLLQ